MPAANFSANGRRTVASEADGVYGATARPGVAARGFRQCRDAESPKPLIKGFLPFYHEFRDSHFHAKRLFGSVSHRHGLRSRPREETCCRSPTPYALFRHGPLAPEGSDGAAMRIGKTS